MKLRILIITILVSLSFSILYIVNANREAFHVTDEVKAVPAFPGARGGWEIYHRGSWGRGY